jgi:FkbM family methyltransferase
MAVTLVQWIDRQSWVHDLVRRLRLRAGLSRLLSLRPLVRRGAFGTRVEVADLESFYLSDEIFRRETYRRALVRAGEVKTVLDLGCNVGFFCCYLRHHFGRTDFRGLGIDANPTVLGRARRNLERNALTGIQLRQGLVGGAKEGGTQDFYLYASHLGSSQFVRPEVGRVLKGDWAKIEVPVLEASGIWQAAYGDEPIDLMKMDSEGSEGALLKGDPALFRRVRCLVLEWHKWLVPENEIFPQLLAAGLSYAEKLEAGETTELWFFSRESANSAGAKSG